MKEYRFDYLKEWVEQWQEGWPKTLEAIEGLPFGLLLFPIMDLDENGGFRYIPARDHYWESIFDIDEWLRQRHEYCKKLAKEYETLQNQRR